MLDLQEMVAVVSFNLCLITLSYMFNSGWYDVIVLPVHDCKWTFKEGDVAVLAYPRPGSGLNLYFYDVLFLFIEQ